MEGKGPVGEGEEKNRAGSVMGFVQLSGVTGRWPVLGTAAVPSPPRHATVARVGSFGWVANAGGVVVGSPPTGTDSAAGFCLQWPCWITTAGSTRRLEKH